MARTLRSDATLAASVLGLGLLLILVGNLLLAQWEAAERLNQRSTFDHLLGFAVCAAGIAIVIWWALSLFIAFLASLLHQSGHRKRADSLSKFSPGFMLRIAVAVMSLNLLGAGVAQADTRPPVPGWHSASPGNAAHAQPAWIPASAERDFSTPASADDNDKASSRAIDPRWQPQPPVVDPGLLSRQSSRSSTQAGDPGVVVKDGDSLWSIAASRLGPFATDVDVALIWPRWYAANRETIGSDPAVLLAGQVLQPPSPG
ncbi:LysM peptidoglycan-binding domain-containing protein [Paenarthrobacter sp. NPDC090517]|uniref:LysM peptidoglycan-binding domain-containing protein n=1 Tax=Paenarthrobacter sp. NPDC090517 TaxID=3364381 RepID=UPI00382C16CE